MTRTHYYYQSNEITEQEFFSLLETNDEGLTALCECLECGSTHDINNPCPGCMEEYYG